MSRGMTDEEPGILFFTSMPGVSTRSDDKVVEESLKNGFHVTAICHEDETKIDDDGNLSEYFKEQFVTRTPDMGDAFRSDKCRWPANKGEKEGKLRFFAFYPSRDELWKSIDKNHFDLSNASTKKGTQVTYDYRMKNFRVNNDISRHLDFVTAMAEATKSNNLYSGVKLNFEHQLSRVKLTAVGTNTSYDIEIAGVRIGRVVVEGDFIFNGTQEATPSGSWKPRSKSKESVEYIFREGDTVIPIDKNSKKAVSIMGKGGWAMVIPHNHKKWNHEDNTDEDGLYFSVLMRIKDENGMLIYPYMEGAELIFDISADKIITADKMNVIYLSVVKETGKVEKRLYKKGNDFFTDPSCSESTKYNAPPSEEIRNYGWAAVPQAAEWKAGYQYTYTLDYSGGVGVEDPEDVLPGEPIIFKTIVGVGEDNQKPDNSDPIVAEFEEVYKEGQEPTVNITIE